MNIYKIFMKVVFLFSIAASPFAAAEEFMSEREMLSTFSGITLSGFFRNTYVEKTRWTQVYAEFEASKTEGTIKGDVAGKPYDSIWFIKSGKWCENWGTGNGCYDLVRVDEKTIRAYEKGTPLKMLWKIQ